MRRWLFGFAVVGVMAVFCLPMLRSKPGRGEARLNPLSGSGTPVDGAVKLPQDAILVNASTATYLVAPFLLKEEAAACGGVALMVTKGSGTKTRSGRAQMKFEAVAAGKYQAWARALWRDSCSNSVCMMTSEREVFDVGNDNTFNSWHWIRAGEFNLVAGINTLTVLEREDGIALDQFLFTRETKYLPVGQVSSGGESRGVRRFADDFMRSPGHGMEGWDLLSGKWEIAFSFDPNRIPNQYALTGSVAKDKAEKGVALVRGPPWYGCRLGYSFYPPAAGSWGAVVDRSLDGKECGWIGFTITDKSAALDLTGFPGSGTSHVELGDALRLNQWHRIVVERWAFVLRVSIDERVVLERFDLPIRAGKAGLFAASGDAIFDDVVLEEIPWQADDGKELKIAWTIPKSARWFRPEEANAAEALVAQQGSISTSLGELPVEEIIVQEAAQNGTPLTLNPSPPTSGARGEPEQAQAIAAADAFTLALETATRNGDIISLRQPVHPAPRSNATVASISAGREAKIRKVAVRYGRPLISHFTLGPYSFKEAEIEDPSDYLDFTPEELKKMAQSGEAEKLRREPKFKPMIGSRGDDNSPWIWEGGNWRVDGGVLRAQGPGAQLRLAQEFNGDLTLRMRVRLMEPNTTVEMELNGAPERGLCIQLADAAAPAAPAALSTPRTSTPPISRRQRAAPANVAECANPNLRLVVKADGTWHDLTVTTHAGKLSAKIDKGPASETDAVKGDGGRIVLRLPSGRAEFDDVEVTLPRHGSDGNIYPFMHTETDWWRTGNDWKDHGGISCILSSSWISLNAPTGSGLLWNKRSFAPDMLVAFDIEESTEWYGWDKQPTHVHHPFDNICVVMAPADAAQTENRNAVRGYRLEINADQRTATILFKDGKEVARFRQDGGNDFPMRFYGGHAPYFPRRNRISLIKRGSLLRALIDGREIIRYEDPAPLDVMRAAIGGYNTHINFSQVEVRRLGKE